MEEIITLIAKTYGLVGLLLAAPLVACVFLWRENKALHKEVVTAKGEATEAQKQRVADAQAVTGKLLEMTKEQASLNMETNVVLERLVGVVNHAQDTIALVIRTDRRQGT